MTKRQNGQMWLDNDLTKEHTLLGYTMLVEDENGITAFFQPEPPRPPNERDYYLAYSYQGYLLNGGKPRHNIRDIISDVADGWPKS